MNLNNLSDHTLLERMQELVKKEREVLIQVLYHLREIDRRKLYSTLSCTSLFDYACKKLSYSEDQASRRIAAMRMLRELPELEQKIAKGTLTMSNIGMAQTLFRQEKKLGLKKLDRDEKLAIFEKLENQPRRQAQKVILQFSSTEHVLSPDKIRPVSESMIEIKFVAPEELQLKIEKLRGLLAHKFPELTLGELFDNLCELGLLKYDPCRYAPRAARVKNEHCPLTIQ